MTHDDEEYESNSWDPDDEYYEYGDMPGFTADDREEAYDNFDWDSLDQEVKE